MSAALKIGKVAAAAGLSVQTVRHYETQGLIPEPDRSPSGYRLYSSDTVYRLRFITQSKALGFSLVQIRDLLTLRASEYANCDVVRRRTQSSIDDIDTRITHLQAMKKRLVDLVDQCSADTALDDCPILNALGEQA